MTCDLVMIGGGAVGSAVLRAATLVGLLHTAFDAPPAADGIAQNLLLPHSHGAGTFS